jgi:uncharacterized protein YcfJ
MKTSHPFKPMLARPLWLAAVALAAIAGCAPYPVYQEPVAQSPGYIYGPGPVYGQAPVYGPGPATYDYRRRGDERLFQASVTSVRAVGQVGAQRCWIEREQVPVGQRTINVPGAIVGGIVGGVIGHQLGGGSGRDIATAGGVVVGAAVGSQAGNDRYYGQQYQTQDVQRCSNPTSQYRTEYYDVTYNFQGQNHRVQMSSPPGSTITVNQYGVPRT